MKASAISTDMSTKVKTSSVLETNAVFGLILEIIRVPAEAGLSSSASAYCSLAQLTGSMSSRSMVFNFIKLYNRDLIRLMQQEEINLSDKSDKQIYGKDFQVDEITDPESNFPPTYRNATYQLGCYENLCVCCGKCCIGFIACCNVMTCFMCTKCCKFSYSLPTSKAGIVEQFGRFTRMLTPGFNIINPCSEEVIEVDMRLNTEHLGRQTVITMDNITLAVEASVYFRTTNPLRVKYTLGTGNVFAAIREAAQAAIRTVVGGSTLDNILKNRVTFLNSTKDYLQQQLNNRGILIEQLYLTDMMLPPEIMQNLTAAARQKRLSEAQIIMSKAEVETAKLMKESSELLNSKAAMQIRYLQMLQEMSNQNKKMVMFIPVGVNKIGKVK